jgi:hypothetical protein
VRTLIKIQVLHQNYDFILKIFPDDCTLLVLVIIVPFENITAYGIIKFLLKELVNKDS